MLVARREELTRQRVQTINRLHRLLCELTPGEAKKDLTSLQAKRILASVRPRDLAGKTPKRLALEQLAELVARHEGQGPEQGAQGDREGLRLEPDGPDRCRPDRRCPGPGRCRGRGSVRRPEPVRKPIRHGIMVLVPPSVDVIRGRFMGPASGIHAPLPQGPPSPRQFVLAKAVKRPHRARTLLTLDMRTQEIFSKKGLVTEVCAESTESALPKAAVQQPAALVPQRSTTCNCFVGPRLSGWRWRLW
jgi:hypothetical protein